MADYQPLILRAVEGLDKNTSENRRALYERARTALVAQLRGVEPTLDESEITRERLALEEAIRKVEAESARRAREERKPLPRRNAEPLRGEEPARAAAPPAQPVTSPPQETPPPPEEPRWAGENEPVHTEAHHPPHEPTPGATSLTDTAVRGFRNAMSDPAAAPPPRMPRQPRSFEAPAPVPQPPVPPPEHGRYDRHEARAPQPVEDRWEPPPEHHAPPPSFELSEPPPPPPARPRRPQRRVQDDPAEPRPLRASGRFMWIGLIVLLAAVLAGLGWWQRDTIAGAATSLVAMLSGPSAPAPTPSATAPQQRPKITDRIGQPQTQPAPAVAQRVVLYEEDPNDPQGKRVLGSAVWRTEMMAPAPGRPAELAVRADVDVPERQMKMTFTLRRNADPSLPASHTIEIMFTLPPDAPSGGVQNVPGVLMKQAEQTRGVPLAGLAVKVTPGFFLIGLSSLEADMQRNIQLLKERPWFDIPMVYANNRRAILAIEKGTPGERAFNEAFAAWKQ